MTAVTIAQPAVMNTSMTATAAQRNGHTTGAPRALRTSMKAATAQVKARIAAPVTVRTASAAPGSAGARPTTRRTSQTEARSTAGTHSRTNGDSSRIRS